ncbi:type II toxin-antitoxin system Phd/YefM family antitoxin [Streptomyces blattellae]|uniref:type II toxin-antitoxin system Phd/YefM family antitoxin n=1 Tax=Streptomyces blattellae TaxID=2569855 RepID=UPI002E2038DA
MYDMETTAREFNQNASRILAAAERGESITVTKNGRPVAVLSPVGDQGTPVPPIRRTPWARTTRRPCSTAVPPWTGRRAVVSTWKGQGPPSQPSVPDRTGCPAEEQWPDAGHLGHRYLDQ